MPPSQSNNSQDDMKLALRQSLTDGMKQAQEWGQIWQQLIQIFKFCISLLTLPWLPIMRTKLGERRFGLMQRLMGLFVLMVASTLAESPTGLVMILIYMGFCIAHAIAVHRRRKSGERWHSYCQGISRLQPYLKSVKYVTVKDIDLYLDPAVLILTGLAVMGLGDRYGLFIIANGIALMIEQRMLYSRHHNLVLDQIDQMIVSEQLSDALSGKEDVNETQGFIVPGAASWSDEERQMVTSSLSGLDPVLKAILDPLPEDNYTDSRISQETDADAATRGTVTTLN